MRKPIMVLLAASLLLASCGGWGDSRANPRNWFGNSRSAPAAVPAEGEVANPLIPKKSALATRPDPVDGTELITNVTELRIERTPSGAIIYATGIASRQGAFDVELRPDPVGEDGDQSVLSFTFRVAYPKDPTNVGNERSRTVVVARSLTSQDLQGIRLIRVAGVQNVRESRRR